MADIQQSLGLATIVTIDGKEYSMRPLMTKDLADIQAYIKKERIKTWLIVAKELGLDEKEKAAELRKVMNASVTDIEMDEFLDTAQGQIYSLYLALKDNPGITIESIDQLIKSEAAKDLIASQKQEIDSPSTSRAEASP